AMTHDVEVLVEILDLRELAIVPDVLFGQGMDAERLGEERLGLRGAVAEIDPEAFSRGVRGTDLVGARRLFDDAALLEDVRFHVEEGCRFSATMRVRGDSLPKNTPGVATRPLTSATLKPWSWRILPSSWSE